MGWEVCGNRGWHVLKNVWYVVRSRWPTWGRQKKIHCVSIAVRGSVCFDRPLPGQFDHLKIPPTPDQQVLATTSDQALLMLIQCDQQGWKL